MKRFIFGLLYFGFMGKCYYSFPKTVNNEVSEEWVANAEAVDIKCEQGE